MEQFLVTAKIMVSKYINYFVIFNKNAFYYILYFIKNYWIFLFVVAAISFLMYFEIKTSESKFIDDKRRII